MTKLNLEFWINSSQKNQFPKEEIIKMASEMTKYFTYLGMTRTFANAADSFFMRIFYRCPKMSAAIWHSIL